MQYEKQHEFTAETLTADLLNAEFNAIEAAFAAPSYITEKAIRVLYSDLTESVNDTDENVTLWTAPAGTLIFDVQTYVETQFTGGGVASCDLSVGDSGDRAGLLELHDVLGPGDDTWVHELQNGTDKGAYLWTVAQTVRTFKPYIAATAITATLNPDAGHALDELTAGSLYVVIVYLNLTI